MLSRWKDKWKKGRHVQVRENALISGKMEEAIRLWMRLYTGDAPWVQEGVVSLNLPAFVASEVARLATVEMGSQVRGVKAAGDARARYLDAQYQQVVDDARVFTEYAAAGGSLVLKPYVDGGRILVDYVKAGAFWPTAYDASGQVTGCLFEDRCVSDGVVYTRVEAHEMVPAGCRIRNKAYKGEPGADGRGKEVPLAAVDKWADIAPEVVIAGVTRPLFALLRMPYANTVDPQSPLGVSAFARAVDLMREADLQFSRLLWEMQSGERALYVDIRAFMPEDAEAGVLPFKRFYRMMDADPQGETLFREWSPAYRDVSQANALDQILQRVEDACGLSRGSLSEAPESSARGARSATELKIMRQRTYAMVRDTQKAVEVALRRLLWAMDVWCDVAGLCVRGDWDVSFAFDDSVVTDRSEEFAERVKLVEMGAMEAWEMRMWYMGESAEAARAGTSSPPCAPPGPGA